MESNWYKEPPKYVRKDQTKDVVIRINRAKPSHLLDFWSLNGSKEVEDAIQLCDEVANKEKKIPKTGMQR